MKKLLFLQTLICLLAVSCSVQEPDTKGIATPKDDVFYASLESYSDPDTRVYVDEKIKLHWDADDRISLFNETTLNQEYYFTGNTGDKSGTFKLVDDPFGTGTDLEFVLAVYPYHVNNKISNAGVMTLTLPADQTYREGSFGRGANTMVSCTEGDPLEFKNVGGYLVLKFYGNGTAVSSIKLEGNNDELLSGKATFSPAVGVIPTIKMDPSAEKSDDHYITLTCEKPVELKAAKEDATIFWLVVPPTDFEKGFTLTVTNPDGKAFVKKTDKNLSIVRNTLLRIAPIEVKF